MRKPWSQRWSRWGCSALVVFVGMAGSAGAACKGEEAGGQKAGMPAAPAGGASGQQAGSAAAAGSDAAAGSAGAMGAENGPLADGAHADGEPAHDGHDGHDGHAHGDGEGANAAGAPEVEKIATARVVELAQASIRKMEELSARAAETKGNCPELAAALDAFYQENSTFIAEMNGLDEQMTKLQRRITEEKFTAPMQKAMTALLEQMMTCRDDPAVAKAFLRLQR